MSPLLSGVKRFRFLPWVWVVLLSLLPCAINRPGSSPIGIQCISTIWSSEHSPSFYLALSPNSCTVCEAASASMGVAGFSLFGGAMCVVGIDVGKHHLDVATVSGASWRVDNSPDGLSALLGYLLPLTPSLVVLEPTGGYERPALVALAAASLPVALVNPRKVRDFARSVGQLAKTDAIDARLLARYGSVIGPQPSAAPDPSSSALAALVARRRDVLLASVAERNRLGQADAGVVESIDRHLSWLRDEVAALDLAIARAIRESPAWAERAALLRTVPGVGPVLASVLLVQLPELGRVGRSQVAALVGVAPYNVDSGKKRGYRRIIGGRAAVRAALYMPTITATKRNPAIAAMYERLRARGKPHRVAIVACMRRLLTIMNAMVRSGQPWEDRHLASTLVPVLTKVAEMA